MTIKEGKNRRWFVSEKSNKMDITKKGWLILDKIVFSEMMWSTYFRRNISDFFSILSATYSPVIFYFAIRTRPNEPVQKNKIDY